jgi:hypothetical protein
LADWSCHQAEKWTSTHQLRWKSYWLMTASP